MKRQPMGPILGPWFKGMDETPPDPQECAREVMARLPDVRQRGRWLPFPAFHRKAQTPTATGTTEYQPSPIPATNGHAPTVIGRTQTMFSPVKAITAGALVFALGGVLLIAQPFDQQGSVPGAEQGAEPAAPVFVSGKVVGYGDCDGVDGEVDIEVDGVVRYTQFCTGTDYEWSDPRLEGTVVELANSEGYDVLDDSWISLDHRAYTIENDDGAWRMRPQLRFDFDVEDPDDYAWMSGRDSWWDVLDGEGAYDGLVAILNWEGSFRPEVHGFIVPSDVVPPAPEGASTK